MNVTIAGAGVIGCAIAHELATVARACTCSTAADRAAGPARASAGILRRIEGHDPAILALGVRSLDLYDEFVRRVVSDSSQEVEYERNGTLEVAMTLDEAMALRRRARALAGSRIEHALLDAGDVRRLEPEVTLQPSRGSTSARTDTSPPAG